MAKKLPGAYKNRNKRKHRAPPVRIIIECPGCGWHSRPNEPNEAECEYILHMTNVHHGLLECAFCPDSVGRGLRFLPDFGALAAHVKYFHPDLAPDDIGALPPHAFK